MGRRWGKTILGGCVCLGHASQGAKVAWVVPTYKNGRPLWRWAEAAVAPLRATRQVRINQTERVIEFPEKGGFVGIYSADSPDAIRGEWFHLAVLDEAALIAEDTWTGVIQPTLADASGEAFLISTPKGLNWFHREWLRGRDRSAPDVASFTAPTTANPSGPIRRAAALAAERIPERTYRQEWLAEFVTDQGAVFRRIADAATAEPQDRAADGHQYIFGVDWGRTGDFTAIAVVDATDKTLVALDRFNQVDFRVQTNRLKALAERFRPDAIVAEQNSIGLPLVEQLYQDGLPVQPFQTTNATKAAVIDGLALAFERGELQIPDDPVLIGELLAYEAERLPSGLIRYGAPSGSHDDTVIALALAWYGASTSGPLLLGDFAA